MQARTLQNIRGKWGEGTKLGIIPRKKLNESLTSVINWYDRVNRYDNYVNFCAVNRTYAISISYFRWLSPAKLASGSRTRKNRGM